MEMFLDIIIKVKFYKFKQLINCSSSDLSNEKIQRKLDLCTEMMQTLSHFEPGISNSVLNCQFELTAAKMMIAKRQSQSISDFLVELHKPYNLLISSSENKSLLESRLSRVKEFAM